MRIREFRGANGANTRNSRHSPIRASSKYSTRAKYSRDAVYIPAAKLARVERGEYFIRGRSERSFDDQTVTQGNRLSSRSLVRRLLAPFTAFCQHLTVLSSANGSQFPKKVLKKTTITSQKRLSCTKMGPSKARSNCSLQTKQLFIRESVLSQAKVFLFWVIQPG